MSEKLPLSDPRRVRDRDNKLWLRDKERASRYGFSKIPCPCLHHRGTGRAIVITEIERHLIKFGRSPDCRTWRGPHDPDSSDEEWEQDSAEKIAEALRGPREHDNGLHMRDMLQDIYQQVEEAAATENTLNEIAMTALQTTDDITGINEDDRPNTDKDVHATEGAEYFTGTNTEEAQGTHDGTTFPDDVECGATHAHTGSAPHNSDDSWQDERSRERLENERAQDAKSLEDAMRLLYNGTSTSKLGATVMVVNLVATHSGITNKAADDIFATIKCLLPPDNCLPGSLYQAKALTNRLGLDFKNIEGCPTGCVLFDDEETKGLDRCPVCDSPRYRDMVNRTRPLKVLRFFPVTPRLQRFLRIPALSKLLRWHKENASKDGKVRYPADSIAWKKLDAMSPEVCDTMGFGTEDTDVRLQISCDGICPFKQHKSSWSAWPVIATLLNLPPWLITKKFFTLLTLLIPGRSQVPFQYFDVWMRPLIEEMKDLWKGVAAYDVLKPEGERVVKLRAAVLYTTHDFPGYGTVSGAAHQGYTACPPCGEQLRGTYAYESRKITYRDSRRWLPLHHTLRSPQFDRVFGGRSENRGSPVTKSPAEQKTAFLKYRAYLSKQGKEGNMASQQTDLKGDSSGSSSKRKRKRSNDNEGAAQRRSSCFASTSFQQDSAAPNHPNGTSSKRKREKETDPSKIYGMKRWSIFYELPYWEHLEIRNSLDIMHCEKNFSENILKTICGFKEKDSVKVRRDMEREGIHPHLWMVRDPKNPARMLKPAANYVLTPKEFDIFCSRLENIKVPSGYCSEIGTYIRTRKFSALKSHDYHILLQTLMPLALRGLMDSNTRMAIMRASRIFRRLCCKVWDPAQADDLLEDVAVTLCLLEITFPLTFFDIMSHLPLHLVKELIILGPTQVRWMYPIERTMMMLKNHVKNRARPEASIAQGYLLDETMGFATSYMQGYDAVRRRVWDSEPEDCEDYEVLEGAAVDVILSRAERDALHKFVLRNSTLTAPLYSQWEMESEQSGGSFLSLEDWMKQTVHLMHLDMDDPNEADTLLLSNPPSLTCKRYARMTAYGNHWRVDDATSRSMPNFDSGVACFESTKEPLGTGKDYVGELQDILVPDYGDLKTPIIVFSCTWKKHVDNRNNSTYVRDKDGFLVVNFKHNIPKSMDPYVFPSQCTQVFFAPDDLRPRGSSWKVVLRKEARSRRIIEEDEGIYMNTNGVAGGVLPSAESLTPPVVPDLTGAIILNETENAIALQGLQRQVLRNEGRRKPGGGSGKKRKRS